jgi:type IV pilus assembly protein PilZ
MVKTLTLDCILQSQTELNLSYIPFVVGGGLFVPMTQRVYLGDIVIINLKLPTQASSQTVEGKVVWITPKNALYQAYSGVGVQLIGANAKEIWDEYKANLDDKMDVGGYIFGMQKSNI